jgi:hypothetical protein
VVLVGGANGSNNFFDTWVWDGTNWTQESPASSPSLRNLPAIAYDAARAQVVLFGGLDPFVGNGIFLNDAWVWPK